jgi:hypothetical protein
MIRVVNRQDPYGHELYIAVYNSLRYIPCLPLEELDFFAKLLFNTDKETYRALWRSEREELEDVDDADYEDLFADEYLD